MNSVTPEVAGRIRRLLLRAFAGPPGVRIEHVDGCPILIVAATGHERCRVDDTPVAQVNPKMCVHHGERYFRQRIGGVLLAAVRATDGMLVRSGRQHFLIADGALIPIDRRVYEYVLRLRTAAIAPVVRLAVGDGYSAAR